MTFEKETWVVEKNPLGPPADPKKATPLGSGLNGLEDRIEAGFAGVEALAASKDEVRLGPAIGRPLLRVLYEGLQDATLLIIGDSTSASYSTWVGKLVDGLAARFPTHTVKYRDWTLGKSDYNEAVTKQTGSVEKPKTLTVYNCSVGSQNAYFQMAPYFETMIASKQPDLIIFNHGHNHGPEVFTPEPYWRDSLVICTQAIQAACPLSEIVLIGQNPRVDVNQAVQAKRQHVTEKVAELRGFGYVNAHRLFLDVDASITSLLSDEIHPNSTGYTLIANEILRRMNLSGSLPSQQPSTFLVPAVQTLSNGDFASFPSPPTLPSWTTSNVTPEKDTTNYESPNGYAVRLKTITSGTPGFIAQNITGNAFRRFKGKWATLLIREFVPVGQERRVGRPQITEIGGSQAGTSVGEWSQNAEGFGFGQGGFKWVMCTRRIGPEATGLNATALCNEVSAGDVTIDRIILTPGIWPRDIR